MRFFCCFGLTLRTWFGSMRFVVAVRIMSAALFVKRFDMTNHGWTEFSMYEEHMLKRNIDYIAMNINCSTEEIIGRNSIWRSTALFRSIADQNDTQPIEIQQETLRSCLNVSDMDIVDFMFEEIRSLIRRGGSFYKYRIFQINFHWRNYWLEKGHFKIESKILAFDLHLDFAKLNNSFNFQMFSFVEIENGHNNNWIIKNTNCSIIQLTKWHLHSQYCTRRSTTK